MESIRFVLVSSSCACSVLASPPPRPVMVAEPAESARCPSKWGALDERGSGNRVEGPANGAQGNQPHQNWRGYRTCISTRWIDADSSEPGASICTLSVRLP